MARNAPFRFDRPLTVGDLQDVLDRWVANKQGRNARVVIECCLGEEHKVDWASLEYRERGLVLAAGDEVAP
jgi:hypothetical protein